MESEKIHQKTCVLRLRGGWNSNDGNNNGEQPEPQRRRSSCQVAVHEATAGWKWLQDWGFLLTAWGGV